LLCAQVRELEEVLRQERERREREAAERRQEQEGRLRAEAEAAEARLAARDGGAALKERIEFLESEVPCLAAGLGLRGGRSLLTALGFDRI
jgi:hypothetical protein